jgi:hypothetical protein
MTPISLLLYIWLGAILVALISILAIRFYLGKPLKTVKLVNIVSLALAVYAALSSGQLIYQALTVQELQKLLGGENIPSLILGGVAIIWVSLREIYKLCTEQNP